MNGFLCFSQTLEHFSFEAENPYSYNGAMSLLLVRMFPC